MATIEPDYWAAAATVAPVLAAALIIEARATLSRIDDSMTIFVTLSLVHAIILGGLAMSINYCFQALRGVQPSAHWTVLIENSVTSAVGLLVLAPATVLAVNSFQLSAKGGLAQWYKLRVRLLQRANVKTHRPLVQHLTELDELRTKIRQMLRTVNEESKLSREELVETLRWADEMYEQGRKIYEDYPAATKSIEDQGGKNVRDEM